MKKGILIVFSLLVMAMSVVTLTVSEKQLSAKSLLLANVNALSQNESGDGESAIPVPGPEGWTRGTCQSSGGNWNMATVVQETKLVTTTCKVTGKVVVLGCEVSGSYEKDTVYDMIITVYNCGASNENCCIKMGSYYGDEKLS